MRTTKRIGLLLLCMCCCLKAARADLESFVVPVVSEDAAPRLDGKVEAAEWRHAARLTGLVHLMTERLSQRQVAVYVVADPKHLYIAVVAPHAPAGVRPKAHRFDRDNIPEMMKDDRVEVQLLPPDPDKRGRFYLITNPLGIVYDHIRHPRTGREIPHWDSAWKVLSTVDDEAWCLEIGIAHKEFRLRKGDEAGTWGLNVSRAWLRAQKDYAGLVRRPHQWAEARFIEDAPAVRIEQLGDLNAGRLDLHVAARGQANQPAPVALTVECRLQRGPDTIFEHSKELKAEAAVTARITLADTFEPAADAVLFLRVHDPAANRDYYRARIPLGPRAEGAAEIPVEEK